MEKSDALKLGEIIKIQGKDGEIVCYFDTKNPERYGSLEFIFIEIDQRLIPFHIQTMDLNGNYARVSLEDISGPEDAQQIVNRDIYTALGDLPYPEDKPPYIHEIIGFTVIDQDKGEIGRVMGILEQPEQSLMQIIHNDKEILIPLVEELILEVDKGKNQIIIEAPDGLIDLYMD